MGAVYKALHTKLNKVVALKVLPTDRLEDQAAVQRFEREMQAVGQLDHPNIVRAMDAGESDGNHFLVMELVDGLDLSTIARTRGRLPLAEACELIRQAALGLQEAHEQNMVHRDIKPSNLMLARARRSSDPPQVKILDMGLALLEESERNRELTNTGQVMGTLDYMAPEQGLDSHAVDIRADVYSLGATLFKLLAGESPFPTSKYASPVKRMMAVATEQAASITTKRDDLPSSLVALVDRMLARDPDQRLGTPQEVADALSIFTNGANLAELLELENAKQIDHTETQATRATKESLKSDSVETAPTIDVKRIRQTQPRNLPRQTKCESLVQQPESKERKSPGPRRAAFWGVRRSRVVAICLAAAGILLLSVVTLLIRTKHGTIVVMIDDPSIQVVVKDENLTLTSDESGEEYQVSAGEHTLHIKQGDLEFDSETFALRRGDKLVFTVRREQHELQVVRRDDAQQHRVIGSARLESDAETLNSAIAFDGADHYVLCPVISHDDLKEATIEATVIAMRAPEQGHPVVSWTNGSLATRGDRWQFRLHPPNVRQAVVRGSLIEPGRRVHLAGVFRDGKLIFYINGERVGETDQPDGYVRLKHVTIGGTDRHPAYFPGVIDEVRVSSIARYRTDFTPQSRFEADERTLALYHFDENQGPRAIDASRYGKHASIVGGAWHQLNAQAEWGTPIEDGVASSEVRIPADASADQETAVTSEAGRNVASQQSTARLLVSPDGVGDTLTLDQALRQAKPGDSVVLQRGEYQYRREPYLIDTPRLTLLGNRQNLSTSVKIRADDVTIDSVQTVAFVPRGHSGKAAKNLTIRNSRAMFMRLNREVTARIENSVMTLTGGYRSRVVARHCTFVSSRSNGNDCVEIYPLGSYELHDCILSGEEVVFRTAHPGPTPGVLDNCLLFAGEAQRFRCLQDGRQGLSSQNVPFEDLTLDRLADLSIAATDCLLGVDPRFTARLPLGGAGADYRLRHDSPAIRAASDGSDLGALPDADGWPLVDSRRLPARTDTER